MSQVVLDPPGAAPSAPAVPTIRQRRDAVALVCLGLGLLSAAVAVSGTMLALPAAAAAVLLLPAAAIIGQPLIPWSRVLLWLLVVILFIPIRRYKLPGGDAFGLEPYRIVVALVIAMWVVSLLIDQRVRLRKSGLDGPLAAIMLAVVCSIVVNPARAAELQAPVIKSVTFLLSFFILFYFVVSIARTESVIDTAVKTLVIGGSVIAVLAVVESRTGFAPFQQLDRYFPFLQPDPSYGANLERAGSVRATGPAEHPISLGAALVMLVPLGVYLVKKEGGKWFIAITALMLGVLATASRTGVVALFVLTIVYLCLRPRETIRLWPLALPLIVATQIMMPGTLGSLAEAFFPQGGVVAEQQGMAGSCSSSGRVADLGPTLGEVGKQPLLGYGYGTRITETGPDNNACILDNQWLGTLLDVGILGALAWLWLFVAVVRRLGRRGKHDDSATGWLIVGATGSVTTYSVGMLTYDALTFVQVTLFLFIIMGLAAAAARNSGYPIWPPRRGEFGRRRRKWLTGQPGAVVTGLDEGLRADRAGRVLHRA
jgi:hypothetical protein